MKKSLIALAVLATTGAAFAQSSVTMYGRIDLSVGSIDQTSGTFLNSGNDNSGVFSGALTTSRYGFRGTEDLGGGLKGNFVLETAVKADTGAQGNSARFFDRAAWLGLAGGFGEVNIGKNWTALDDIYGAGNSGFDGSRLAISNVVWESAGYADIPNSTIKYVSPSFGGFSGAASYSLDQTIGQSTDVTSFQLSYAAGPVAAAVGYQEEASAAGADRKTTMVNGSFDFGVARLIGALGNVSGVGSVSGAKANDYHIGVDVPLGSALSLSGGYASSKQKTGGVTTSKTDGFGIAAKYSLSKRTTTYAGYRDADTENGAGVKTNERKEFIVGVNHAF